MRPRSSPRSPDPNPARSLPSLLALLPMAAVGCVEPATYGALKRFMYEEPGRGRWQQPDAVVTALALSAGDRVADLGSGGGYFTYRFAEAVGETGRVFAIDVDADLLAYVESQAQKRKLPQIEAVSAANTEPGIEVSSVDLVFLANVFHHLPEPEQYFANARKLLRPGGRIAVVEVSKSWLMSGHTTSAETIAEKMQAAGYALVERHAFLSRQSFQIFAPRVD